MSPSRTLLTLVGVALLAASLPAAAISQDSPVQAYREGDEAASARNILPPGQGHHLTDAEFLQVQAGGDFPPHNTDQIALYEDLIRAAPDLTADDLDALFKDASFGVPAGDVGEVTTLRDGAAVIIRDLSYDVPHIYGLTRDDAMYAAGYVNAQDRLFAMDALRHLGRGKLSELTGPDPDTIEDDLAMRKLADYTEEELTAMADRVETLDPELGPIARADVEAYVAGVNQYIGEVTLDQSKLPAVYHLLQQVPEPWTVADTVAVAVNIGAVFSPGGGAQLQNAAVVGALEDEGFERSQAREILADLRMADDPEAPHTVDAPFPFNDDLGEPDPDAVVLPDDPQAVAAEVNAAYAALETIDTPFGPLALGPGRPASNALLVGSQLSDTGQALAVMGPQVGYFSPEVLLELDIHAPGVHARGAAFPGVGLYVLLGRGQNYAWSATTANGDHRDIRAFPLCDTGGGEATLDSDGYLHDGECKALHTRTDTWVAKPTAAGIPEDPTDVVVSATTERTHAGIVQTRALADGGVPYVFVLSRESYMKEVDATLTYTKLHDPDRIESIQDAKDAFVDFFSYSFNWFLVHDDDIAYQLTGHYPVLRDGVDPDLPISGDPAWDPVRLLEKSEIPNATNPASGFITNWNGKQAPDFRAADNVYAFGPTQRVTMLTDGVLRGAADDGKVSLVELTRAMAIAGTQDLYALEVHRLVRQVIGDAGDARLEAALDLIDDWVDGGAHRRDLDDDGEVDVQAPLVLYDAWFPALTEAIFRPTLGAAMDEVPLALTERARPGGSAYFGGWHGQIHRDLRQLLGESLTAPASRTYCGGGDADACRQALLDSLDEVLAGIEADHGTDPSEWDFDESSQDISFSALDSDVPPPMDWQNRPTFQQVLAFGVGSVEEPRPPAPASPPAPVAPLPTTGGGIAALGALLLLAGLARRRRGVVR
ncbi:MAG: penicillin acylase family protein [Actinobacteria bacterium]|nr:penicillin acylase family protein [Actinomycetota bacterium]